MRGLMDKIKKLVIYDTDKEFYAKIFPNSVPKKDLLRLQIMTQDDVESVRAIERKKDLFRRRFNSICKN